MYLYNWLYRESHRHNIIHIFLIFICITISNVNCCWNYTRYTNNHQFISLPHSISTTFLEMKFAENWWSRKLCYVLILKPQLSSLFFASGFLFPHEQTQCTRALWSILSHSGVFTTSSYEVRETEALAGRKRDEPTCHNNKYQWMVYLHYSLNIPGCRARYL